MNVSIVGCGGIGLRWIQGWESALASTDSTLYIVEPYPSEPLVEYLSQVPVKVFVEKSISALPDLLYDLVVIATTAEHRCGSLMALASKCLKARTIVLEKNLCQSLEQLRSMSEVVSTYESVKVNCPNRHLSLAGHLRGADFDLIKVVGDDWGLACNLIHWVDLYSWLLASLDDDIVSMRVDECDEVFHAKRHGLREMRGVVTVSSRAGRELKCVSRIGFGALRFQLEGKSCSAEWQDETLSVLRGTSREIYFSPEILQSQISKIWLMPYEQLNDIQFPDFREIFETQKLILATLGPFLMREEKFDRTTLIPIT